MSIRGGPDIIEDGLVLHLDAADKNSYSGSGSTWYDLSGNDNHATLYGDPPYETARGGRLWFNGPDYADCGMSDLSYTEFSFSVWLTTYSTGTQCIIGKGVVNQTNEWSLNFGNGSYVGGRMRTYSDSAQYSYTSLLNQDHMITMSAKNSSFVKLYIDGSLVAEKTSGVGTIVNSTHPIKIGSWYTYNTSTYFRMYQASVYNKALTANEVQQNYNATKGRFGL